MLLWLLWLLLFLLLLLLLWFLEGLGWELGLELRRTVFLRFAYRVVHSCRCTCGY